MANLDKDLLQDFLNFQKHSINVYATMLMETSSPEIRTMVQANMLELYQDQFEIFQIMSKKGFYQTQPAKQTDINAGIEKAKTMKQELK